MVVDDNTEYLQVLSSVLSSDFDTIKATGIKEALDILQVITVDAICSDFNMKDGTGLDLLEIIRQKGLKTPFLLMSGDDSRALEQKVKLYYGDFCCKTNSSLSNQSSETLVFSRKIGILILVPYVFSLVFALMSRNKGNFLFRLPRPLYQAVLRKFVSLPS